MDVKAEVRTFLAGFLREHHPDDDEDIFASGFVNSLFVMQLIHFVETELSVSVDDDDLEFDNFRTVNAIAAFVERKKRALPVT